MFVCIGCMVSYVATCALLSCIFTFYFFSFYILKSIVLNSFKTCLQTKDLKSYVVNIHFAKCHVYNISPQL